MKTLIKKFSKNFFFPLLMIFCAIQPQENLAAEYERPSLIKAAENTVNSVVHIKTIMLQKSNVYAYFYDSNGNLYRKGQKPNYFEATGSGVILTRDGYIVTNNHVVAGASEIAVTLNDKRKFKAKIVGRDPATDLAVIKIDTKGLKFLEFGNSDDLHIGEWVLAVGNPFNLTSTVTAGIVSAKARNLHLVGPEHNSAIASYIQTDAAVNSGNSGGALVNEYGLLIGINAAIASNTGSYTGYSFAIPSNIVKKVVGDIIQFGQVKRAYLGVQLTDLTEEIANYLNMNKIEGVLLTNVITNGAAWRSGIKMKDVILQIDGLKVNSSSELVERLGQYQPGETIVVSVWRSGQLLDFSLKLDSDNQQ
ncbi:MAG: trypsin-like peptidase domain-containing protein [Bacteroidales bacterium]|nr:trypsin-like peptidase domain-containing protein [Bacteroidales bacterium]